METEGWSGRRSEESLWAGAGMKGSPVLRLKELLQRGLCSHWSAWKQG